MLGPCTLQEAACTALHPTAQSQLCSRVPSLPRRQGHEITRACYESAECPAAALSTRTPGASTTSHATQRGGSSHPALPLHCVLFGGLVAEYMCAREERGERRGQAPECVGPEYSQGSQVSTWSAVQMLASTFCSLRRIAALGREASSLHRAHLSLLSQPPRYPRAAVEAMGTRAPQAPTPERTALAAGDQRQTGRATPQLRGSSAAGELPAVHARCGSRTEGR